MTYRLQLSSWTQEQCDRLIHALIAEGFTPDPLRGQDEREDADPVTLGDLRSKPSVLPQVHLFLDFEAEDQTSLVEQVNDALDTAKPCNMEITVRGGKQLLRTETHTLYYVVSDLDQVAATNLAEGWLQEDTKFQLSRTERQSITDPGFLQLVAAVQGTLDTIATYVGDIEGGKGAREVLSEALSDNAYHLTEALEAVGIITPIDPDVEDVDPSSRKIYRAYNSLAEMVETVPELKALTTSMEGGISAAIDHLCDRYGASEVLGDPLSDAVIQMTGALKDVGIDYWAEPTLDESNGKTGNP